MHSAMFVNISAIYEPFTKEWPKPPIIESIEVIIRRVLYYV